MTMPNIYFDTNVLRDCIKHRNDQTIHVVETARDKNWLCHSSIFSIMELLDVRKDEIFVLKRLQDGSEINQVLRERFDKNLTKEDFKQINDEIENFFKTHKFVKFMPLTDDGWNLAAEISSTSSISAADALHLATALKTGCDLLVTSDEVFIKNARKLISSNKLKLQVCRPNQALSILEKLSKGSPSKKK